MPSCALPEHGICGTPDAVRSVAWGIIPPFGCRSSGDDGVDGKGQGAVEPSVAIFARNRKPWDGVPDSVVSYDAQPTWSPDEAE